MRTHSSRWTTFSVQVVMLGLVGLAGVAIGPKLRDICEKMFPARQYANGDFTAVFAATNKRVVLFSLSTCQFCERARKLLDEQKVDYAELVIDASDSAEKMSHDYAENGVPVLLIGNRKITGFKPVAIMDALEAAATVER